MKTLTLIALSLLALNCFATSPKMTLEADITSQRFDPASPLAGQEIASAKVVVNFARDLIELQLNFPWTCPDGAICATVMPATRFFRVENLDVETNECGMTIYQAEADDRPVDGLYQKITVSDHTSSACPQIMIYPPLMTTIKYEVKFYDRLHGQMVEYTHYFNATELH